MRYGSSKHAMRISLFAIAATVLVVFTGRRGRGQIEVENLARRAQPAELTQLPRLLDTRDENGFPVGRGLR